MIPWPSSKRNGFMPSSHGNKSRSSMFLMKETYTSEVIEPFSVLHTIHETPLPLNWQMSPLGLFPGLELFVIHFVTVCSAFCYKQVEPTLLVFLHLLLHPVLVLCYSNLHAQKKHSGCNKRWVSLHPKTCFSSTKIGCDNFSTTPDKLHHTSWWRYGVSTILINPLKTYAFCSFPEGGVTFPEFTGPIVVLAPAWGGQTGFFFCHVH
jgi:hypothetical protein